MAEVKSAATIASRLRVPPRVVYGLPPLLAWILALLWALGGLESWAAANHIPGHLAVLGLLLITMLSGYGMAWYIRGLPESWGRAGEEGV